MWYQAELRTFAFEKGVTPRARSQARGQHVIVAARAAGEERCSKIAVVAGNTEVGGDRDGRNGSDDEQKNAQQPFAPPIGGATGNT